jgi:UDP-galactopyranose mutase
MHHQPHAAAGPYNKPDLLCLCHLSWDFVFQRPHHLMSRFARERRVFFWQAPVYDAPGPWLDVSTRADGLVIAVPHLPWHGWDASDVMLRELLDTFMAEQGIGEHVAWYYDPLAMGHTRHLQPLATVYDVMDELKSFRWAPDHLPDRERELLERADLVFTGGRSIYEARVGLHPSVHLFPSSIDAAHFKRARGDVADPADQAGIPHPRIGYCGVLDERLDLELVRGLATARPDWQLVFVGPAAKLDEDELPRAANIHYLGGRPYAELPGYLGGWDVAALFFARNEHTRFISPTKTPEYLAAGLPTVSSPIVDVVRAWGSTGLVHVAETVDEWVLAIESALGQTDRRGWLERVDRELAKTSWDRTWGEMSDLLEEVLDRPTFAAGDEWDALENEVQGLMASAGD